LSINGDLTTRQNETPERPITQLTSSVSGVVNLTIALQLAPQPCGIKTREKPSL
jgi:hypothetical protein